MAYIILLHPKAEKALEKLDSETRRRVREKVMELEEFPRKGEPLRYSPFWRSKVGDCRVIYEINEERQQVIILFIGHRKKVYDDFSKLL
ncbi:MAG: type II toxin-antitoxin system RelE family toxin [Candidatus Freyarchaeota archaeon]